MTSIKEEEVDKAFCGNRALGLGHKCVAEGEGDFKIVQICETSFMDTPLFLFVIPFSKSQMLAVYTL